MGHGALGGTLLTLFSADTLNFHWVCQLLLFKMHRNETYFLMVSKFKNSLGYDLNFPLGVLKGLSEHI